ncbi:3573_t:CDS:1 [Diversispora eburnea]|uniref:3573_t:CDS:1 n=1 Tax=Diversispora eburnea TaxID=1213867 RepID=A0A9N9C3S4_9GLOM|nr:3573_t:CDS:1 [Diversispora eburnea]
MCLLVKERACRRSFNQLRNFATVSRFFDPKNDVAFKKLFGEKHNQQILLSFLNSILRRKGDDMIQEVSLLPQEQFPQFEDTRKTILDVLCRDKKGHRYIVEMQNKRLGSFIQRMEYYASRTYSDQLFKNVNYFELKQVILLAIANHNIFPSEVKYVSFYYNREEETNKCFLPNLSYAFVELPKFTKCREQLETTEDYWVHLLKEASEEQEPPERAPNEIQEAYGILERHRWNPEDNLLYEKTRMALLDDEYAIRTAKDEGRSEGRKERNEEIAREALKDGLSVERISKITGLSISIIKELNNQ